MFVFLFQNDHFENGIQEVDDQKSHDKAYLIVVGAKEQVEYDKKNDGKELDDARQHVARHETPVVLANIIP